MKKRNLGKLNYRMKFGPLLKCYRCQPPMWHLLHLSAKIPGDINRQKIWIVLYVYITRKQSDNNTLYNELNMASRTCGM